MGRKEYLEKSSGSLEVILPNANHVVFLSNETEVMHEMTSFIRQLPTQPALP